MDEPTSVSPSNIFQFPGTYMRNKEENQENEDSVIIGEVNERVLVSNCLEAAMLLAEDNEDITGVVCLLFDKNSNMQDLMGGDINATILYVMLDKLKADMMRVILETLGYDNTIDNDGDDR